MASLEEFAPNFESDPYSKEEADRLKPFFTNLEKSVYSPLIFSPEVIGALCSRTSRAAGDLRKIFLEEYLNPFLTEERGEKDTDEEWEKKLEYGQELKEFIEFLQKHPIEKIFSNPRARSFYAKWLAQYGDDSIAQMAGMHLVYSSLSQVAIKHFEDQRIGLAPIEKSTRYVNYSNKVKGQYLYYTDPTLKEHGLEKEYRAAMDGLFDTYLNLLPKLQDHLQKQFPDENAGVVEKKAFDTLRGLLPTSTLSQVAFFGNGQSYEYAVSRSLKHPLGEVRWAGDQAYQELYKITPSFLRRVKDPENTGVAGAYQAYLGEKQHRTAQLAKEVLREENQKVAPLSGPTVELLEYDPDGENKVLAGILFASEDNHASWEDTLAKIQTLSDADKERILDAYLSGREQRWQKVGRAFENTYMRFEIVMNIGAWRDLQRHRMLTQQRQLFTVKHGYDLPPEIIDAGLDSEYKAAIEKVEEVHNKIAAKDEQLAQYCVAMAHRIRFMQWKNLRECFWELELRTIPEGHPDYRTIEQEKFKLIENIYPRIAQHMRVNLGDYDFARRGQDEKIQAKLKALEAIKS